MLSFHSFQSSFLASDRKEKKKKRGKPVPSLEHWPSGQLSRDLLRPGRAPPSLCRSLFISVSVARQLPQSSEARRLEASETKDSCEKDGPLHAREGPRVEVFLGVGGRFCPGIFVCFISGRELVVDPRASDQVRVRSKASCRCSLYSPLVMTQGCVAQPCVAVITLERPYCITGLTRAIFVARTRWATQRRLNEMLIAAPICTAFQPAQTMLEWFFIVSIAFYGRFMRKALMRTLTV